MCGLIGSINLPFDDAVVDLLSHRGPDGRGSLCRIVGQHEVRLAHRRLAIVDLSANGAQPMSTTDDRHHIVFNGEIYNHLELRDPVVDAPFAGRSDTESLLKGLVRLGPDYVPLMNGIYAFAYLDERHRKLLLARDPFGVKPLYYSTVNGSLSFASEVAPLARLLGLTLDPASLAAALRLRFVPSPGTLYRGIHKLRPGHILEVDLSGESLKFRESPFYPPPSTAGRGGPSYREALEEFGFHLDNAVRRQLMGDVEVGVFLSGGVDSAMVAAIAQKHSSRRLKAFTVGFEDAGATSADETREAAETAAALGLEHHTIRISFQSFVETLRTCIRIVEEPLATTSLVPMYHLSRLAGRELKVVLSGQGADEMLGGYPRYQVELANRWVPAVFARVGTGIARGLNVRNDTVNRGLRALSHTGDVPRFQQAYEVFSEQQIVRLIGIGDSESKRALQYYYDLLDCASMPTTVERMMTLDTRLGLADDLLLYTDKMTMRASLECRVPLLDHDLARFLQSLPASYRVRFGKGKILQKEYAKRILPRSVLARPKKGFPSPTQEWFRKDNVLQDLLLDRSSRFGQVFNLDAVGAVIEEHRNGFNRERQLFLLLSLQVLLEDCALG